jgi:hypothetical protein
VGVGRIVAVGLGVGVTVGVGVGVTVGLTVGVGVGVTGGGVGLPPPASGAWMLTETGEPVLKKLIRAVLAVGGPEESNPKLYNVPQRIAFAFGFCTNVSVFHVAEESPWVSSVKVHGALLYPASPTVPSCGQPGC